MKRTGIKGLLLSERGMASMTVSLILMAIITLIVLGFAQTARRNARQTLDNQLSTQAFYAAESGINDARKRIGEYVQNGQDVPDKKVCGSDANYNLDGTIDGADNSVKYTCLLITGDPTMLVYNLSTDANSVIIPIVPPAGKTFANLEFEWKSRLDVSNPLSGCPNKPQVFQNPAASASAWPCGYGVLRVDLAPVSGNLTRDAFLKNTFTGFFSPSNGGDDTVTYTGSGANVHNGTANQGTKVAAHCTGSSNGSCKLSLTGLAGNPRYYMRVSTLYRDATLQLRGHDTNGNQLGFTNVQAVIDSTGKAQDVLRRMQVRIPLINNDGLYSDYPLETTNSICKQFSVFPGYSNTSPC